MVFHDAVDANESSLGETRKTGPGLSSAPGFFFSSSFQCSGKEKEKCGWKRTVFLVRGLDDTVRPPSHGVPKSPKLSTVRLRNDENRKDRHGATDK